MKPNPLFTTWTIDDVTACMDLPESMCMKLWEITHLGFDDIPTVSELWHKLTKKEKTLLNSEAERYRDS